MSLETQRQLDHLYEQIGLRLDQIRAMFVPDVKVTLVARNPNFDDADVILTDDDLDAAIASINNLKNRMPDMVTTNSDAGAEEAA